LKVSQADFAAQLVFYFAIVVVQVYMRRVTEGALFGLWDGSAVAKLDGFEGSAVFGLIGFEDCLEV